MPLSKFQCKTSIDVGKLANDPLVSPSKFVEWQHLFFSKLSGRDFSVGPKKEHVKFGVKWVPFKVVNVLNTYGSYLRYIFVIQI